MDPSSDPFLIAAAFPPFKKTAKYVTGTADPPIPNHRFFAREAFYYSMAAAFPKLSPEEQQHITPYIMGCNEQLTAAKAQLGFSSPEARAVALAQFQDAAFSLLGQAEATFRSGAQTMETYKLYFILFDSFEMLKLLEGATWRADPRVPAASDRSKACAIKLGVSFKPGAPPAVYEPLSGASTRAPAAHTPFFSPPRPPSRTPPPPPTRTPHTRFYLLGVDAAAFPGMTTAPPPPAPPTTFQSFPPQAPPAAIPPPPPATFPPPPPAAPYQSPPPPAAAPIGGGSGAITVPGSGWGAAESNPQLRSAIDASRLAICAMREGSLAKARDYLAQAQVFLAASQ